MILRKGPHAEKGHGYNTIDQAMEDGAVIMAYGYAMIAHPLPHSR